MILHLYVILFTGVCVCPSIQWAGVSVSGVQPLWPHPWTLPPGRHPLLDTPCLARHPPWADTPSWIRPFWTHPLGRHPQADTPWADTSPLKMTSEVGGTHPTGMHSCSLIDLRYMIECCSILDHFW